MLVASMQAAPGADVSEARLQRAIALGVRAEWIEQVGDLAGDPLTVFFAEHGRAHSERRLAEHVKRVRGHRAIWPTLEADEFGVTEHQANMVAEFRSSALAILAGTPGTGKTFTAAALIKKLLKSIPPGLINVCAPTGKAAVRITAAMQRYNIPLVATTIHRLLGVGGSTGGKWTFRHNEMNPLESRVVIVDESSMIDTDLAAALFAAIPPGGNVLLIGDPYQLPPVGHGAPLRDLIYAGVPHGLLSEIKRNSGLIVSTCKAIKDGASFRPAPKFDRESGNNLIIAPCTGDEAQRDMIVSLIKSIPPKTNHDPVWDVQVLVATNDRSAVSRKQLNKVLQDLLNPPAIDDTTGGPVGDVNPKYRVNDKIICLSNTEMQLVELAYPTADRSATASWVRTNSADGSTYLANGDMGLVEAVDANGVIATFTMPDRTVKIRMKKRRDANDERDDDANDFDLAYAITVHKSQGSEFPIAIVVLDAAAKMLTSREWLYTAISRASELCILVGSMGTALKMAIRPSLDKRKTFLRELIDTPVSIPGP
jgi:exodeoxyribonuclease V alpha subunit